MFCKYCSPIFFYIMHVLYSQKHEKFNVAMEKEDKKPKVFLY